MRWISNRNWKQNKQAYNVKIAKLFLISLLMCVSILIGNPPKDMSRILFTTQQLCCWVGDALDLPVIFSGSDSWNQQQMHRCLRTIFCQSLVKVSLTGLIITWYVGITGGCCGSVWFTFCTWLALLVGIPAFPFPEGELGLPWAEPFPLAGKKAPPSESIQKDQSIMSVERKNQTMKEPMIGHLVDKTQTQEV